MHAWTNLYEQQNRADSGVASQYQGFTLEVSGEAFRLDSAVKEVREKMAGLKFGDLLTA